MTEGLVVASDVKTAIGVGCTTVADCTATIGALPPVVTKYVTGITAVAAAGATQGEITVTFNATNVGTAAAENTLTSRRLSLRFPMGTQIAAGVTGAIDWACQSDHQAYVLEPAPDSWYRRHPAGPSTRRPRCC